jgi:acetyltransferase-like isoleucine patch superfamily enzyme
MKLVKKIFMLIGNIAPPPLNKFFYMFGGVKFEDIRKTWVGNNCYFDTECPELIIIKKNVCISSKVIFITHFDPTKAIKLHQIKNYQKKIVINENVFIGPGSIINPGIILEKNCFVTSGCVVKNNFKKFDLIEGNPAKRIGNLNNSRYINLLNLINKK